MLNVSFCLNWHGLNLASLRPKLFFFDHALNLLVFMLAKFSTSLVDSRLMINSKYFQMLRLSYSWCI